MLKKMKKDKEISFRVASKEDIPFLCQLLSLLFEQEEEFSPNDTLQEKALTTIIDIPSFGHILVAIKDEVPIAMISILYSISTALGGRVGVLEDMIVHPDFRTQRVGSALLEFATRFAKEQQLKRLTLLTDMNNKKAHSFYLKEGFTISKMTLFRKLI
ncbi:MAG: GNAT family N-acetyltransferase [Campylobacterales bacterium]|nr:GNAT family N-acetyltransferase [Campylobacterales bacterium]